MFEGGHCAIQQGLGVRVTRRRGMRGRFQHKFSDLGLGRVQ